MFKDPKLNQMLKNARWQFAHKNNAKKGNFKPRNKKDFLKKPETEFEKMYKICSEFKSMFCHFEKETKIRELCLLAKIKIENTIPYKKRREKKHRTRKLCWVCREVFANYQHHIILLINGGYDNGINRIPICEDCHKRIHPFLETHEKVNEKWTSKQKDN